MEARTDSPDDDVDALLARADADATVAGRLIDVAVVARRLAVSSTAVRNWITGGKLSAVRTPTGRYRRMRRADG